ncbi:malectin/receptor-like protein kinase family protein [Actinidia rufa]|uniref:Malectin/receptor-like protein kinase family protein n=1 Tax=Actinidia rufa TaxID=165716 RepID=A0A7J0H3I3_9ERIC|nr:malectin/receptor-like protein kinase family protein [Actinidia rufa]
MVGGDPETCQGPEGIEWLELNGYRIYTHQKEQQRKQISRVPFIAKADGSSPSFRKFTPPDNYLINCRSPENTVLEDGRTFKSDSQSASFLSTDENILASINSIPSTLSTVSFSLSSLHPLYLTARIFQDDSMYRFLVFKPGWHWSRLYFYPLPHPIYNLTTAIFDVTIDSSVLLHWFSVNDNTTLVFKEYLIDITSDGFSLKFSPTLHPLYLTARIFQDDSMYRFLVFKPGWHWLCLYFYPLPHPIYNLTTAIFDVTIDSSVLLHRFSVNNNTALVFKEYLIDITSDGFSLKFSPTKDSFAFVNAIELVSSPNNLIPDSASSVSPIGDFHGLFNYALEVSYLLNMGGPIITPRNDTLSRTWLPDTQCMIFPQGARNVSVALDLIKYPAGGATPCTGQNWVYATAKEMVDSGMANPRFNLTWITAIDPTFSHLIRMHFCDIVSVPFYKDFVVNASTISNSSIMVQVGPASDLLSTLPNAILNGLEVMKMSNLAGSLDGLFSSNGGRYKNSNSGPIKIQIAATFALAMGVTAILLLVIDVTRWRRQPQNWNQKRGSFSSWLFPLNTSQCSFMSSKSKSSYSSFMSTRPGLGWSFTFIELRDATKNFDESAVIGAGGFGKVPRGAGGWNQTCDKAGKP